MEIQESAVREAVRSQLGDGGYALYADVIDEALPALVQCAESLCIEDFRGVYQRTVDRQASLVQCRNPLTRERAVSFLVVAHEVYRAVERLTGHPAMDIPYALPGPNT